MADFSKFRSSAAWKRARRIVLSEEDTCGAVCNGFFIGCGRIVDKTLPPRLPGSPEVDHLIPLELGGDPIARENLTLMHKSCNQIKLERMPDAALAARFKLIAEDRWNGTDIDWSEVLGE